VNESQEALEYRRKILREYAALVSDDDFSLSHFRSRMSKSDQAVGYGKAAMVFHMLRDLIGDEAFWAGLQQAALEGRGRRYGWNDLRRHFEATAGEPLGVFFNQWVERPGAPRLHLSDVNVTRAASGWQVSGLVSQDDPDYDLAVPLRLVTAGRTYEQVIGLSQEQDCFLFTVSEEPVSITVDPDNRLFRQLYAEEQPATINNLRASRSPLVVVSAGDEELYAASRDLLRGLQWQHAEVVDENTLNSQSRQGRDVLVIGEPGDQSLLAELAEARREIVEHGAAAAMEDSDVLFLVKAASTGEHVLAFFIPETTAAAQDTARRIPHYGRYSYLAFRDGQNLYKATWEPERTPLKVVFNQEPGQ